MLNFIVLSHLPTWTPMCIWRWREHLIIFFHKIEGDQILLCQVPTVAALYTGTKQHTHTNAPRG